MKGSFSDTTWEEKIAYQNVLSFRKKFHYSQMAKEFQAFISQIAENNYTLKGPLFYSLNNVPMDEMVDIEMFFPVYENHFENISSLKDFRFHSYFEVSPVLKGTVTGDFENQTERVYAELLETLTVNQLEINTPFFHVTAQDGAKYMYIYIGYISKEALTEINNEKDRDN